MKRRFYIVGVGASAGGQKALTEFFFKFPKDFPMAFVVVTHLLRTHRSQLDKILARRCQLNVQRLRFATLVKPGNVYIMPEDSSVIIKNGVLHLQPRPKGADNKTIDKFFRSLAEDQQEHAIAIVLSGSGVDGTTGTQIIHEYNGTVMAQSLGSTEFKHMPMSVIEWDHPQYVMAPHALAEKLIALAANEQATITGG